MDEVKTSCRSQAANSRAKAGTHWKTVVYTASWLVEHPLAREGPPSVAASHHGSAVVKSSPIHVRWALIETAEHAAEHAAHQASHWLPARPRAGHFEVEQRLLLVV